MDPLRNYANVEQLYDGLMDNLGYLYYDSLDLQQFIPDWNDSSYRQILVKTSSPAPQSSKTSAAPRSKRSLLSWCLPKYVAKVLEFEPFYLTYIIYSVLFVIDYYICRIRSSILILLDILNIVLLLTVLQRRKRAYERSMSNFERMNKAYFYMVDYKVWSKRIHDCALNAIESIYAVKNDLQHLNDAELFPESIDEVVDMINDILASWFLRFKPVDHLSLLEWFPQAECLLQRFITGLELSLDVEEEFMHFMQTTAEPTWFQLNGWEMENEEMEQCLLRISRAHKKNIVLSREVYKIINQSRVCSNRHDFLLDRKIRQL